MQAISNSEELKMAIRLIQIKQNADGRLLKEQFLVTYGTLKPENPILNIIKEVISTPNLINILAVTGSGLANVYLSKFLAAGSSANLLRKVLTVLLQSVLTRTISKRSRDMELSTEDFSTAANRFLT